MPSKLRAAKGNLLILFTYFNLLTYDRVRKIISKSLPKIATDFIFLILLLYSTFFLIFCWNDREFL